MHADATMEQLPKFCYEQSVNNFRRFIEKKTTLYEPTDVWLYNKDYLEIMFPKLKLEQFRQNLKDPKEIHKMIRKTNIPAINLDLHNIDYKTFKRIIDKDKLIRENTFVYDVWGSLLIVWYEGQLSICNLAENLSYCNVCYDFIENLHIVDLIFKFNCAEYNMVNQSQFLSEEEILITLKIPFPEVKENLERSPKLLEDLIAFLQRYFFSIHFQIDKENNFVMALSYQNVETLLDRIGLNFVTYEGIKTIVRKFFNLSQKQKDD